MVVILIGASIFADVLHKLQNRGARVFHIFIPSIQALPGSRYLIEQRVNKISKHHAPLPCVIVAQIPGNSIFPANVQSKGHAHNKYRAPILETAQTFINICMALTFQTRVKILVIPPLPRLLNTVCKCTEAIKYDDGLKELRDIEHYVHGKLVGVQDMSLITTRQVFEKIFCNSKIYTELYKNNDVEPKTRLKRCATKDAIIRRICSKYLLVNDMTHLTNLGGEVYAEAVLQSAVDLHKSCSDTGHSGKLPEK